MASRSSQPHPSRHVSHRQASSSSHPSSPPQVHRTASTTSEDSQTVLLNNVSPESSSKSEQEQIQARSRPRTSSGPRKCWICFSDETEDTPTSSAWRSPCPCALRAHESCLLDWIADIEAPSRRRRSNQRSKIECPQCKTEILIARPRSYVVDGVNAIGAAAGRLIVPSILVTLAGGVLTGCWLHGFSTIYILFGTEDAERLFGFDRGARISGNMGLGLPFIPIVLILSRTSLADSVLPVLPIFFLGTKIPSRQAASLWPPSAAMTLAMLPYLRGVYNEFYKRILAPREKAWLKEIQPRAGEDGEEPAEENRPAAAEANEHEHEMEGGLNFELGLEVEIFDDDEEHAAPIPVVQPQPAADNPPPPQAQNPPVPPNPHQHVHQQQNIILSTTRLADTILGALLFPTISATMGALLSLCLPRSWMTKPTPPGFWARASAPTGLLQSRFGRSVVGGCLFVVLKDAVVLYSRFRLAQGHRQRRVLDWGEGRGRTKG
ncbi:hypothetical protein MMC07_004193 [Pseudocyphellaria aurata]|nr:hypothetical protein [Pseudocyphellaria aurata]